MWFSRWNHFGCFAQPFHFHVSFFFSIRSMSEALWCNHAELKSSLLIIFRRILIRSDFYFPLMFRKLQPSSLCMSPSFSWSLRWPCLGSVPAETSNRQWINWTTCTGRVQHVMLWWGGTIVGSSFHKEQSVFSFINLSGSYIHIIIIINNNGGNKIIR